MYWTEKLIISSSQQPFKYDPEATANELQKGIKSELEEYGYEGDELKKVKEWYTDLLTHTDDEIEYTYKAYRNDNPVEMDFENIPFCEEYKAHLPVIFDAFEEICERLKIQSND